MSLFDTVMGNLVGQRYLSAPKRHAKIVEGGNRGLYILQFMVKIKEENSNTSM